MNSEHLRKQLKTGFNENEYVFVQQLFNENYLDGKLPFDKLDDFFSVKNR